MAAVTRAVAGALMNQVGTARQVSISTTENPLFPLSYLWDYRTDRPFRYPTTANGQAITVDRAVWNYGDMETWSGSPSAPTGFSVGGAVVRDNTNGIGGSSAARSGPFGNNLQISWEVRSGWTYILEAWPKSISPAAGFVYVYNEDTGNWLQHGTLTWASAFNWAFTSSQTTYAASAAGAFAVESFAACDGPTTTLRFQFQGTGTAAGKYTYWDQINLWPRHSATGVFGAKIPPVFPMLVKKSNDAFVANSTTIDTLVNRVGGNTFLHHATANDLRWSRFHLFGANNAATIAEIGELVMTQDQIVAPGIALSSAPEWTHRHRQVVGDGAVYSITDRPARDVAVAFLARSAAEYTDLEQEIRLRMDGALWPCILQLDETSRPDLVFCGRGEPQWQWQGTTHSIYPTAMTLRGEAPPAQVA